MTLEAFIIDGDQQLRQTLEKQLKPEHFSVENTDRQQCWSLFTKREPALVIFNTISFGQGHLDLIRQLRATTTSLLLALLDPGDSRKTTQALEAGADACLLKPVHPRELVARVHSLQRRLGSRNEEPSQQASPLLQVGELRLDRNSWSARINHQPLPLTLTEFHLLCALLDSPGRVKFRSELMETVLGKKDDPGDHSLKTHICNLRRKLTSRYQHCVKTIRGVGYVFEAEAGKNPVNSMEQRFRASSGEFEMCSVPEWSSTDFVLALGAGGGN